MKFETIKHVDSVASCVSDSIAEQFKDKITLEQYDILVHNVFTIEEKDEVSSQYHGAGSGWVEVDAKGDVVMLHYDVDEVDEIETLHHDDLFPKFHQNGNMLLRCFFSSRQIVRF